MPIRPRDPSSSSKPTVIINRAITPASLAAERAQGKPARNRIVIRSKPESVPPVAAEPTPPPDSAPIVASEPPAKRPHHKTDRTGPNWDENGDYLVGRDRTPERTRWKPGHSGNPRGPTRKVKLDPLAAFDEELLKTQKVRINGEEVELDNYQLSVRSLLASSAKGNVRATIHLMAEIRAAAHRQAALEGASETEIEAWEQEAVEALLAELGLPALPVKRKARDEVDGSDTPDDRSLDDHDGEEDDV